jgi:hypothetical protein
MIVRLINVNNYYRVKMNAHIQNYRVKTNMYVLKYRVIMNMHVLNYRDKIAIMEKMDPFPLFHLSKMMRLKLWDVKLQF